jgi:zinc transport system permease protein
MTLINAILVTVFIASTCPLIGAFVIQRNMSLMGDAVGHIALSGVALGWVVGSISGAIPKDKYAILFACVVSVAGGVLLEFIKKNTSGDMALAILMYGGMAAGVILIRLSGGTTANLMGYLFGSIATVTNTDIVFSFVVCLVVGGALITLKNLFWMVNNDAEYAQSKRIPTRLVNCVFSVLASVTIVASMRVVGVLLVGALMIIPIAASSLFTNSLNTTLVFGVLISLVVALSGVLTTYMVDLPPGATIILLLLLVYIVLGIVAKIAARVSAKTT